MAGPLLVNVDRSRGKGPRHVTDSPSVVEVDMGHDNAGQFLGTDPSSSSAASRTGTDDWLPVSMSTGAGPSIR